MFLSSYRNTVLNQSACESALGYFLIVKYHFIKLTNRKEKNRETYTLSQVKTLHCRLKKIAKQCCSYRKATESWWKSNKTTNCKRLAVVLFYVWRLLLPAKSHSMWTASCRQQIPYLWKICLKYDLWKKRTLQRMAIRLHTYSIIAGNHTLTLSCIVRAAKLSGRENLRNATFTHILIIFWEKSKHFKGVPLFNILIREHSLRPSSNVELFMSRT